MNVLEVAQGVPGRLVVTVETDQDVGGCPACGVVAVGHGRRVHQAAGRALPGAVTVIKWRRGIWRCLERTCPVVTFSEQHELVAPRAKLTSRAIGWATDALAHDDTTVSAPARHLWVGWHTLWDAIEVEASRRLADPSRLDGVTVLGLDEHIWRASRIRNAARAVTGMVDPTRDEEGRLHARLLDVVPGRTGTAYAAWIKAQPEQFTAGITQASLDPFRGYANALRDELPDAASLVLHYLPDWSGPMSEFRRVLTPGGRLLISVNHPGAFPITHPELEYFGVTKYTEDYEFAGKTVDLTFYHRPLSAMASAFAEAGFRIAGIHEPPADPETPAEVLPEGLEPGGEFIGFLFFELEARLPTPPNARATPRRQRSRRGMSALTSPGGRR